ncbi:MAG: GH116 family glycosyl hydrolase [Terriglobia bacterium]|jgi:hypothetical protein
MFRYFLLLVSLAATLLLAPLAYSASAQLTVRDSVTRSPIAGAIVTEFGSGRQLLTDSQGTIMLPTGTEGTISVAARDYLPAKATLAEGTQEISLTPLPSFQHAVAQPDGSLLIRPVNSRVEYDLTNARVIARVDSRFRLVRYSVVGGDDLILPATWSTRISLDGVDPKDCDTFSVRAGLVVMTAARGGAQVGLTAFVDEKTNAVFLHFTFTSLDGKAHKADIRLWAINWPGRMAVGSGLHPQKLGYIHEKLALAAGDGSEEAVHHLRVVVTADRPSYEQTFQDFDKAEQAASERSRALAETLQVSDPLLKSMFTATLDDALASFKSAPEYDFNAFFAGIRYRKPLRAYYRDSYWAVQLVLPFHPEYVRSNLLLLARGIQSDGRAPSAVLFDGKPFNEFHYDSPALFVMQLYDYLAWTKDLSILDEAWPKAQKALAYLTSTDTEGSGLMEKPEADTGDWADEVFRSHHVTYDEALYYRALVCAARIALANGNSELSQQYEARAARTKAAINKELWLEDAGHYVDYRRKDGSAEDHTTTDSLITVLFGIPSDSQTERLLATAKDKLESRFVDKRLGDWGILACNPLYERQAETKRSSFLPHSYHNAGEWPYLDGVNALVRLWRRDEDWRYPLLRWWEYGLERNWLTPAEVYSAYYPDGRALEDDFGLRQAWSSMPGTAIILGGFGFWPDLDGSVGVGAPPWGDSSIAGILCRGDTYSIESTNGQATLYRNKAKWVSVDSGGRVRVKLLPDGKVKVFDAARPATVMIWEPAHATAHISPNQELVLP